MPQERQKSTFDIGQQDQGQKPHAEHGDGQHNLNMAAPQAFKDKQRGDDKVPHKQHSNIGWAIIAGIKTKRRAANRAHINDLKIASEGTSLAATRATSRQTPKDGLSEWHFFSHEGRAFRGRAKMCIKSFKPYQRGLGASSTATVVVLWYSVSGALGAGFEGARWKIRLAKSYKDIFI
jgi:hypothetical protein